MGTLVTFYILLFANRYGFLVEIPASDRAVLSAKCCKRGLAAEGTITGAGF